MSVLYVGAILSSTEFGTIGGTMTRDELAECCQNAGWNVTGYRWIRATRGTESIEVWFVDGRATSAKYANVHGHRRVNITQFRHPEIRGNLAAFVATWADGHPPELHDGGLIVTTPTEMDQCQSQARQTASPEPRD